ncbi:proline-rich nuclear receptor coactivator 1 [Centroberyx gerrardi]
MLDGSLAHNDEVNIGNVENNNPISVILNNDGVNLGKTRQALLKKGGKKLPQRPPHPGQLPHQKPQRNNPVRLSDHNNNNVAASASTKATVQPGTELPTGAQTGVTLHHLKLGTKKELLKSKGGRLERGAGQAAGQPVRSLARHDQTAQHVNGRSHRAKPSPAPPGASQATRKKDNGSQHKPSSLQPPQHREQKKPLCASDNVKILTLSPAAPVPEDLKDGEKVYAGAKFSEPPSPSVLPKPPSHWVGENEPQHGSHSREQMTVHLKSLLKVEGKS